MDNTLNSKNCWDNFLVLANDPSLLWPSITLQPSKFAQTKLCPELLVARPSECCCKFLLHLHSQAVLCQLAFSVWHLQTADRRLQTADCRLQTADCRPQTADCRPQIADCKLKDTKNLPNKGDTIKNITSCEGFVDSLFFFDYCELIINACLNSSLL